ncbi:hypothetical protein ACFV0H_17250 [Streptomyces erythrochromogenes]|uniref:Uncharacterized protein n=1 Tax=Streptomyces erythrochromogenes TaxID=285574 RepID=A0ABZ1QMT8_9ACTN|nr:hypothetical protein [Streptomyces erythrochromogenes]
MTDAVLVAAVLADAWAYTGTGEWAAVAPGAVAALIALFCLAEQRRARRVLAGSALAYAICGNLPESTGTSRPTRPSPP